MKIIPLINEFTKNFNERPINSGFIKYFNFYSLFYPDIPINLFLIII